jgi:type I restriction enzyme M protein
VSERLADTPALDNEAHHAHQAKRLNEILRECRIKDEFRPVCAATFLLGLWAGEIDARRPAVLGQVNANAARALQRAGKGALANHLKLDETNDLLARRAHEIVELLEKLSIRAPHQDHDSLGRLYETFFRYTGGNTIGQYFTPRHIAELMCELVDINPGDRAFDPACGTGGFLIGALHRKASVFGLESEPTTAALCVVNMLLRGGDATGILRDNCLTRGDYPPERADCALVNPPFPHKKTDTPTADFIDRGLRSLKPGGLLAAIVPYSMLVRVREWHRQTLRRHSLRWVATLPQDLFSPYASFNTAIVVLQAGVPHGDRSVFFARLTRDGFKLKKNIRVPTGESDLACVLESYRQLQTRPELCTLTRIDENTPEWSPEAFIESVPHSDADFLQGLEESIRDAAAFYVRHGFRLLPPDTATARSGIAAAPHGFNQGLTTPRPTRSELAPFRVADYFEVELGGKEEIEDLEEGSSPVVSTSELMNGVAAWRQPPFLYRPPCITVATDGSIGASFVQESPFYAFYKTALLRPKGEIPTDALYYVAYLLSRERWRYAYARKFGKTRINRTTLYAPARAGRPDFEKMARIVRATAAYPIVKSFRDALAIRSKAIHAA